MPRPEDVVAYIRANPGKSPLQLAAELAVSKRVVKRALWQVEQESSSRPRRRWLLPVAVVVASGGITAAALLIHWKQPATPSVPQGPTGAQARAAEQDIYKALERGEKGQDQRALADLDGPDEGLRLAACRYLLKDGSPSSVAKVLPRVDDPAQRVRLATIQLLADSPDPQALATLVRVAADEKRPLAERSLALSSLGRYASAVAPSARELLPVLADANVALRQSAHELLSKTFPQARVSYAVDGGALRAAWAAEIGGNP